MCETWHTTGKVGKIIGPVWVVHWREEGEEGDSVSPHVPPDTAQTDCDQLLIRIYKSHYLNSSTVPPPVWSRMSGLGYWSATRLKAATFETRSARNLAGFTPCQEDQSAAVAAPRKLVCDVELRLRDSSGFAASPSDQRRGEWPDGKKQRSLFLFLFWLLPSRLQWNVNAGPRLHQLFFSFLVPALKWLRALLRFLLKIKMV